MSNEFTAEEVRNQACWEMHSSGSDLTRSMLAAYADTLSKQASPLSAFVNAPHDEKQWIGQQVAARVDEMMDRPADSGRVTPEMVDWLITYQSRLIVNGLHPEDARLWMKSHELKDFDYAASAVDEADAAWNDHFANPDDDGPADFKLSQAFVDRVTLDESGEPPVIAMGALAAQGQKQPASPAGVPDALRALVATWREAVLSASCLNKQDLRPFRFINDVEAMLAAPSAPEGDGGGK